MPLLFSNTEFRAAIFLSNGASLPALASPGHVPRGLQEASALAEYRSIQRESDPELRGEALLSLAIRQEQNGNLLGAAELYQGIASGDAGEVSAGLRRRAAERRDALAGTGSFGLRAEFLARRLAQEATDPSALLGMAVAGGVFRLTRLATLQALVGGTGTGVFSRGLAARAVAGFAGFALEAPAFALSSRGLREALGRPQDWSGGALGRDLVSAYLVLGGLRVAGGASSLALSRLGLGSGPRGILPGLVQQGGTLAGIVLGHRLEQWTGLRPAQDGANTLLDSLATLLQFHVAGRLTRSALGSSFEAWERGMDLRAELLGRQGEGSRASLSAAAGPGLALAAVSPWPQARAAESPELGLPVVMMNGANDGKGPRPPSPRPASALGGTGRPARDSGAHPEVDAFLQGAAHPELGLRAFLDGLPIAATLARLDGKGGFDRIFLVNRQFTELFGYDEAAAGRHPLPYFFSASNSSLPIAELWNLLRSGVFHPSPRDFRCLDGNVRRVWSSGLVRNVYGQNLAFGFYQAYDPAQPTAPAPLPVLKALQAADSARRLVPHADGTLELRSEIDLSLHLTNPNSDLIRQLLDGDLRLRVTALQSPAADDRSAALIAGLNLATHRLPVPEGRRVFLEWVGPYGSRLGSALVENRRGTFATASEASPPPAPGARRGLERTPTPERESTVPPLPASPAPKRGGLLAEVQRTLGQIRYPQADPPPPPPKGSGKKGSEK
ncbi:MAG: hypothetical protein U1F66_03675 [bacterium]